MYNFIEEPVIWCPGRQCPRTTLFGTLHLIEQNYDVKVQPGGRPREMLLGRSIPKFETSQLFLGLFIPIPSGNGLRFQLRIYPLIEYLNVMLHSELQMEIYGQYLTLLN